MTYILKLTWPSVRKNVTVENTANGLLFSVNTEQQFFALLDDLDYDISNAQNATIDDTLEDYYKGV